MLTGKHHPSQLAAGQLMQNACKRVREEKHRKIKNRKEGRRGEKRGEEGSRPGQREKKKDISSYELRPAKPLQGPGGKGTEEKKRTRANPKKERARQE